MKIIATLPRENGAIHYTTEHDAMTAAQIWAAWENGEIVVFHVLQYQMRHNGYFTENGDFIKWEE